MLAINLKGIFALVVVFLSSPLLGVSSTPTWSIHDKTNDGWDTDSKAIVYHNNSDLQRDWAEQALSKFPILKSDLVLDYGCGDGKITAMISLCADDTKGVDISNSMVSLARRVYLGYHPDLFFYLSNSLTGDDLSDILNEKLFDRVVSFSTFHLIGDQVKTLKNIRKSIKKNGYITIVLPSFGDSRFVNAGMVSLKHFGIEIEVKNADSKARFNLKNPDHTDKIMSESGFELIYKENTVERFYNQDDFKFVLWSIGTLSANWNVPHYLEEDFYRHFISEYLKLDPDARGKNGEFSPYLNHLTIHAKKI